MGSLGIPEIIFIFLLALLIFGPRKLPELGRNLGKALAEFRRASNELRATVEDEMRNLEKEAQETERQVMDSGDDKPDHSALEVEPQRYTETSTDGDVKPV